MFFTLFGYWAPGGGGLPRDWYTTCLCILSPWKAQNSFQTLVFLIKKAMQKNANKCICTPRPVKMVHVTQIVHGLPQKETEGKDMQKKGKNAKEKNQKKRPYPSDAKKNAKKCMCTPPPPRHKWTCTQQLSTHHSPRTGQHFGRCRQVSRKRLGCRQVSQDVLAGVIRKNGVHRISECPPRSPASALHQGRHLWALARPQIAYRQNVPMPY